MNLIGIGLLVLAAGCGPSSKKPINETKETDTGYRKEKAVPVPSKDKLVVPGKQAGEIFLGQDMEEVGKILGKPFDGDAAMGKAWSIWHIQDPKNPVDSGEISIYSVYKDSTMSSKVVKQIVVNTGYYATENKLKNNADLKTVLLGFPSLKKVATYINPKKKDTLYVYDDVDGGIAFDVKKSNQQLFTRAMTVHPKKEPVSNTYLTIHPGWKKIQ